MLKERKAMYFFSMLLVMLTLVSLFAIIIFASDGNATKQIDACEAIKSELSDYVQGSTQTYDDDGYIRIPYEITVFYDYGTFGGATTGYNGTPVILYVVNSFAERIGTDSDVNIVSSMIDKGYIVAVLDYKNNEKAVSPDLEYSVQKVRTKLKNGTFFTNSDIFPSGVYQENHVIPAGHNITLNHVFYEIDKHGTDGVLEKIVEVWNVDFRGCKRDVIVKWVNENGEKKTTQTGFDGSSPIWYSDATGTTVDNENGQYTKIQYTKALSITDCVKKDGTPLDFNLYMDIIYPSNPSEAVPLMILACSGEYLANGYAAEDRPYLVGYSMRGYAAAIFDYEYIPMARDDHYGTFSGAISGGITGSDGTFALGIYNRSNYQTAAIRYLRYLSLTQNEIYSFNTEAFGIFGNSKGGFQTFLGAANLRESATLSELGANATEEDMISYVDDKVTHFFNDAYITAEDPSSGELLKFDGNSRYQNGNTTDLIKGDYVVDGGEVQPWLIYTDEGGEIREIPSGVQFVYSSCGGTTSHEWENHAPVFTAANYYDEFGSGYTTHNYLANVLRIYDVPSMFFEAPLKHSFVSGNDVDHSVDTYEALFKFTNYYLKNSAVEVAYTVPANGDGFANTTDDITIKFYGSVTESQITAVEIIDQHGNAAKGVWTSSHGGTAWTFHPVAFNGGVEYTVTVPSSLIGENGKAMAEGYTFSFYTKDEISETANINSSITKDAGEHVFFTVPETLAPYNTLKLRFKVENAAANILCIYEAENENDTSGNLIGTVNIKGYGYYEYDVTDYVMSKVAGSVVYFYVRAEKAVSDNVMYSHEFDTSNDFTISKVSSELVSSVNGEAVTAFKLASTNYGGWYPIVLQNKKVINGGAAVTKDDYGRTFTFTLRVYDTASRSLQLWFNDCTDSSINTGDYDYSRTIVKTVANEWMDISVSYTVYESDYGITEQIKNFKVVMLSTGSTEAPIYFDKLTVIEHVTEIQLTEAMLVSTSVGSNEYKSPESDYSFVVNGNFYSTWGDAVSATAVLTADEFSINPETATVKLLRDYVLNEETDDVNIASRHNVIVDLNGYSVTLYDSSLLNLYSETATNVNYTIKNGVIVIDGCPIITHTGSTASAEGKTYYISFDNVDVTVSNNTSARDVITAISGSSNASVKQNISFIEGCIAIDRNALPSTPVNIFHSGDQSISISYILTGGSVNVSSLRKLTLWDTPLNIRLNSDENGNYTSIVMSDSYSISSDDVVMSDKGYSYFVLDSVQSCKKTYQLTSAKYSTSYGVIPDEYTPEEWPFAVFSGGELLGVYNAYSIGNDNLDNALAKPWKYIRGEHTEEVQIVLRRHYDMTADGALDTAFQNICQVGGTLVIDLNDFVLTLKEDVPLINNIGKYGYDAALGKNHVYDTNIIVKNGTVKTDSTPIINFESQVCTTATQIERYDEKKITNVLFDGVTIDSSVAIISAGTRVNTQFGADLNVIFNNCEFNLERVASAVVLFGAQDSSNMNNLHLEISGGNITAASLENITLASLDDGDSVVFAENDNGKLTTLTVPSNYTIPAFGGVDSEGTALAFANGVTSGENTVYTLEENTLVTKFGTIPDEYASAEDYPWIVFTNGTFYGAYGKYADSNDSDGINSALEAARKILLGTNSGSKSAQILLRADYDMNTQVDNFANLCHIGGTLTIDLGNHTFITGSSNSMFKMDVKHGGQPTTSNGIYDTKIIVIGGTIVPNTTLITFSTIASASRYEALKYAYFTFEGTTFKLPASGNTVPFVKATGTAATDSNSGRTNSANLIVTFNNCTFDLTENTQAVTFFNTNDALNKYDVTVNVNGGQIKANNTDNITISSLNEGNDRVAFGKYEGVSTSLLLPSGALKSDLEVTLSNNLCGIFVFSESGTEYNTYVLTPKLTHNFALKSNITLYTDFEFNVYILASDTVKNVVFDGTEYSAFDELETKLIDGELYYVITKRVFVSSAVDSYSLSITLMDENGQTITGNWSVGVVNYLKRLIDYANTETEKLLAKDILSYIRAIYVYNSSDQNVISEIDSIIGVDYDLTSAPDTSVDAVRSGEGLSSACLELGTAPSFRFYLDGTYDASLYKFTVNGQAVQQFTGTSSDSRTYIQVILYAYNMTNIVSYTIEGTDISGEYNLKSYYEFALTQSNPKLVSLVERLWRYSESAAEYRREILNIPSSEDTPRKGDVIVEFTETDSTHGGVYNDFYVYTQTSDSSGEYYIRYRFKHQYSTTVVSNSSNTANNSNMFRIVGAELVRVSSVGDNTIEYTVINSLLTSGEIAVAIKEPDTVDFIGGYHGEERIVSLTLNADGVEYVPGETSGVVICSELRFNQITEINRCNTPEDKVLRHSQNYSITSDGINCRRSIEWLMSGFEYSSAYLNMFTLLRADGETPICNTVETFDKDGNSLGKQVVGSVGNSDKHILKNASATSVKYTSDVSGFSAEVGYEILNESCVADSVFIAARKDSIGDNKWYASFMSNDGSKVTTEGEIWQLDVLYQIDYVAQ